MNNKDLDLALFFFFFFFNNMCNFGQPELYLNVQSKELSGTSNKNL